MRETKGNGERNLKEIKKKIPKKLQCKIYIKLKSP